MKKPYSTDELVGMLDCRPQTARAALCRSGHYLGIVPIKLPNRKLLWPAEQVERVLQGLPARPESDAKEEVSDWRVRAKELRLSGCAAKRDRA